MTNHPNRAAIRQDGNEVVLRCIDPDSGERVERRFWAPQSGGYVREVSDGKPGTLGQQVCDGLAHRGNTLHVSDPSQLIALIRQQWAQVRRAAATERARW